jgi:hypothetical protein
MNFRNHEKFLKQKLTFKQEFVGFIHKNWNQGIYLSLTSTKFYFMAFIKVY